MNISSNIPSFTPQQSPFSKIDANSDGKVSKTEFISGRPSDASESQASELFDKIDSSGTGSLSETQLSQGLEENKPTGSIDQLSNNGLSDELIGSLIQILQQASSQISSDDNKQKPSAVDLFAKADVDSSGEISQEEFVSSRPSFASEEQANERFGLIDSDGDGSLTLRELEDGAPSQSAEASGNRPPPPPPPSGGGSGSSIEEIISSLDTNGDGVVSLQELLASFEGEQDVFDESSLTSLFSKAIEAYEAYPKLYFIGVASN